jgi:hypothetical protein
MIGEGETDASVILQKEGSGEINGNSRMKIESGRDTEEQEENEQEEVRKR